MTKTTVDNAASPRRLGVESSQTRHALLDAAELIMREEGYAAVTSRHVANRAGLKPQLVYYYFRTMDDLLLALFRRRTERSVAQLKTLLTEPQPLHTLWQAMRDPAHSVLTTECMALANHRKALGEEIARLVTQVRAMQAEMLARILRERSISTEHYPPIALSMLLTAFAQLPPWEQSLGIEVGHAELNSLIHRFLDQLEPPPAS